MVEPQPSATPPGRMALWVPVVVLVLAAVLFVEVARHRHGDFWDYAFLLFVAVLCVGRIYRYWSRVGVRP